MVETRLVMRFRWRQRAFTGAVKAQEIVTSTSGYGPRQAEEPEVDEDRCERWRQVLLFRIDRGPDSHVGRDLTDSTGRVEIPKRNPRARYYAVATEKVINGPDGSKIICDGAKSPRFRAPRQ